MYSRLKNQIRLNSFPSAIEDIEGSNITKMASSANKNYNRQHLLTQTNYTMFSHDMINIISGIFFLLFGN